MPQIRLRLRSPALSSNCAGNSQAKTPAAGDEAKESKKDEDRVQYTKEFLMQFHDVSAARTEHWRRSGRLH